MDDEPAWTVPDYMVNYVRSLGFYVSEGPPCLNSTSVSNSKDQGLADAIERDFD